MIVINDLQVDAYCPSIIAVNYFISCAIYIIYVHIYIYMAESIFNTYLTTPSIYLNIISLYLKQWKQTNFLRGTQREKQFYVLFSSYEIQIFCNSFRLF